jgi:hypothetical protein
MAALGGGAGLEPCAGRDGGPAGGRGRLAPELEPGAMTDLAERLLQPLGFAAIALIGLWLVVSRGVAPMRCRPGEPGAGAWDCRCPVGKARGLGAAGHGHRDHDPDHHDHGPRAVAAMPMRPPPRRSPPPPPTGASGPDRGGGDPALHRGDLPADPDGADGGVRLGHRGHARHGAGHGLCHDRGGAGGGLPAQGALAGLAAAGGWRACSRRWRSPWA